MALPSPLPLSRHWEYARRQLEGYFEDLYQCCTETGVGLGVAEVDYLADYWGGVKPDSCQFLSVVLTDGTVKFSLDAGLTWVVVYTPTPPLLPQTGMLMAYGGEQDASMPDGWLLADGLAVSRTTYATLFALIGTTYGAGNGTTTFNLPDLRGRILVGVNDVTLPNGANGSFTTRALAATFGTETHTLTIAEMPNHRHSEPSIGYTQISNAGAASTHTGSTGGTTTGNSGGGDAHNNMMPSTTTNWIIKY